MRLRTQLTLTVTALVALVVALAGLVIVVRIDHRDRADLDRVLTARAEQVKTAAQKNGSLPTDGSYAIRLIQGGEMLKQVGSSAGFPLPAKDGFSTVNSGDDEWRSLAQTLPTGAQLQILVSLDDLAEQHTDNVLIVDLLVLLAAVLSAAGVWFATGLVLRPFQRLLAAARELDPADPDQRLPEVKSPREVAELTATINDLLDRARSLSPAAPASTSRTAGLSESSTGSDLLDSSHLSDGSDSSTISSPSSAASAPTVEMRAVDSKRGRLSAGSPAATSAPSTSTAEPAVNGAGSSTRADSTAEPSSTEAGSGHASSGVPAGQAGVPAGQAGVPADATAPSAKAGPATANGSAPAAQDPAPAAQSPAPAAQGPASAAQGPAPTAQSPASAAQDPASAALDSASGVPGSRAQDQQPGAAGLAPAAGAVSPAVAELRPSLIDMGAQLDQLLDNPDMPATQRHLILAIMADEHRRMSALLDGDA
ncbi:MAG: HAMP domain-containing protein [Actinomycetota bacterium]|nr:HAMP domain-containing protein [Actinomycetota bacterium]